MAKWFKPYWLIDHLPVPREWRLSWLRSYIDMSCGRDLKRARAAKDEASERNIQDNWDVQVGFLDDEETERFSRSLFRTAWHLRVPIPQHYVGSELSPDYERTPYSGNIVLSTIGAQKVRKEIREEQKWRSEARARSIQYITAFSGLIGTLTGFVAVWHKWGG
jgi:hypothetical protein